MVDNWLITVNHGDFMGISINGDTLKLDGLLCKLLFKWMMNRGTPVLGPPHIFVINGNESTNFILGRLKQIGPEVV